MTVSEPATSVGASAPIEAVAERLNDPAVAASLVTLLDNAELLSTLVLGLSGVMERGDMIMDAVAEGVNDFKAASGDRASTLGGDLPSVSELGAVAGQLAASGPTINAVLSSAMVEPGTIDLLSEMSEAAVEGSARARTNGTRVTGVRSALKSMKDPEVQRGLGLLIEIARSLGRRMD